MAIPFVVPAGLKAAVTAGQVVRRGVNLHDSSTGHIVSHMQEAGKLARMAGGLNPIMGAGTLVSSGAANVQLEQVKDMIGGLQMMTTATLAVSAINLGVSVAGFAVLAKKLNRLSDKIGGLETKLEGIEITIHGMNSRDRARDRSAISSLLERGDEAWFWTDSESVWQDLEKGLHQQDHYYRDLLSVATNPEAIPSDEKIEFTETMSSHEALAHLIAARLQCLILLNQYQAADQYMRSYAGWLDENYTKLTPPKIVNARLPSGSDKERLSLLEQSELFLDITRQQQIFVESVPSLINTLESRGIDGREYIEASRKESEEPVLFLEPVT